MVVYMWNWFTIAIAAGVLNVMITWSTMQLRWRAQKIICREEAVIDVAGNIVTYTLWILGDILIAHSWSAVVVLPFLLIWSTRERLKHYKKHRDHDEDCVLGPRKKREGGTVKLPMWWQPKILWSPA